MDSKPIKASVFDGIKQLAFNQLFLQYWNIPKYLTRKLEKLKLWVLLNFETCLHFTPTDLLSGFKVLLQAAT